MADQQANHAALSTLAKSAMPTPRAVASPTCSAQPSLAQRSPAQLSPARPSQAKHSKAQHSSLEGAARVDGVHRQRRDAAHHQRVAGAGQLVGAPAQGCNGAWGRKVQWNGAFRTLCPVHFPHASARVPQGTLGQHTQGSRAARQQGSQTGLALQAGSVFTPAAPHPASGSRSAR